MAVAEAALAEAAAADAAGKQPKLVEMKTAREYCSRAVFLISCVAYPLKRAHIQPLSRIDSTTSCTARTCAARRWLTRFCSAKLATSSNARESCLSMAA